MPHRRFYSPFIPRPFLLSPLIIICHCYLLMSVQYKIYREYFLSIIDNVDCCSLVYLNLFDVFFRVFVSKAHRTLLRQKVFVRVILQVFVLFQTLVKRKTHPQHLGMVSVSSRTKDGNDTATRVVPKQGCFVRFRVDSFPCLFC